MEYTIENISPVERKVKVEVPSEEVNASLSATIAMYRRGAEVDGFRKGKVPSTVIEKRYRKQIYNEATTDLVNLHINEIMNELKIDPVSEISFEGEELVKNEDYSYSFSFEVRPEFDIPSFEGLEVDQEKASVEPKEIEAVFDRIRNQLAELREVDENRTPKEGDVAVISFSTFQDGKRLDFAADNFELPIGESQSLPEFEAVVMKLKRNEAAEEEITLPEDFINEELAGKKINVRVYLKAVKEKVLPEVDDTLAMKAGGFESVQQMREAVENSYMESRKQLFKSSAQKKLIDQLLEKAEFDVPPSIIEKHVNNMLSELEGKFDRQGKSMESTGKTREELRENFTPEAESMAKSEVLLLAVANKEGLTVSDQEFDFYFQQIAARTGDNANQLKRYYMENNLMHPVRDRLLADKAMELIYSRATVNEVEPEAAEG